MKTEQGHTPGPWKHERRGFTIQSQHPDYRFSLIAQIATGEDRIQEDANAALIAAAPDLLAAGERCVAALEECWERKEGVPGSLAPAIDALRLAISKALPAPQAMATK